VALLSQRAYVEDAVSQAKGCVSDAIRENGQFDVGRGHGLVHHFHRLWPVKLGENQSL
jgi:hydroxymethylpyrimidine/phosphomethylpyrimidine kinase